jgi:hypothetical protein
VEVLLEVLPDDAEVEGVGEEEDVEEEDVEGEDDESDDADAAAPSDGFARLSVR